MVLSLAGRENNFFFFEAVPSSLSYLALFDFSWGRLDYSYPSQLYHHRIPSCMILEHSKEERKTQGKKKKRKNEEKKRIGKRKEATKASRGKKKSSEELLRRWGTIRILDIFGSLHQRALPLPPVKMHGLSHGRVRYCTVRAIEYSVTLQHRQFSRAIPLRLQREQLA